MTECKFGYGFWNLHPNILAHGEQCFKDLDEHFGIDVFSQELSDIEDEAKDRVLEALVNAYHKGSNPFKDSKCFQLANLINAYKLDYLIEYICNTQGLNPDDFEHNAYNDGIYLDVEYKGEIIA